jgi:UDP-4-amino-4-deoxy-L-arabinose formyltransferase/UDP-glucuronic acid dehydrogenase (UDP-4-keto-hexauronic acid decarboxylating)
MRVAVIGRTGALIETTKAVIAAGHTVPLVITAKAAPEYAAGETEFRELADRIDAAYLCTPTLDSEEVSTLLSALGTIDAAVSLNYSTVIGQALIDRFRLGVLNAHGGDLPRYRGNACQAWALLQGERRIGLCIHRMVGGELDSGDVVLRRHLDVTIDTRIGEVMQWMEGEVPALFVEALGILQDARPVLEKQDPTHALRCYPRRPEDGHINWAAEAERVLRLINASSEPYAGAFTSFRGDKLVVWRAALVAGGSEQILAVPGQIARIDRGSGAVDVITGKGMLRLLDIEVGGTRGAPASLITSMRARLV